MTSLHTLLAQNFADYPVYTGSDLGLTYSPKASVFKVWSPAAQDVILRLYKSDVPTPHGSDMLAAVTMKKEANGVWSYTVQGDAKGQYYTFQIRNQEGKLMNEVPDPYAKAVGTNGLRAQVIDFKTTHPMGWEKDKSPVFKAKTDAIIYELHVRDASIAANSGIKNKGKFLGLTEKGTKNPDGLSTGIDHIKELGVTHVHILPSYDFFTVDESRINDPSYKQYNWGYDPMNYNVPEGSYATNPADGGVRIREFKQMVQAMHQNGLRVVMDVVYNHTMFDEKSNFHQLVPYYYHRTTPDGKFSNGAACGNETASDRPMVRKFMIESLLHWVKEYHVDGFRFDLMGLHDIETMNQISQALHAVRPDILLYGEGWTAGDTPLPENDRALKRHVPRLDKIAAFSDDIRDGLKGSVFNHTDNGFVSGKSGVEESIKFGVVASTQHPQVDYKKVNYSQAPWAKQPYQAINYAECHDNHTLWDRLQNSNPTASVADRQKMALLAQTVVLTAQGIPFLHAGMEFLRTKQGVENSYNAPDSINQIDWRWKTAHKDFYTYIRQLIALRKAHPAFRMASTEAIAQHLAFLEAPARVVAYTLNGKAVGDKCDRFVVIYNGNDAPTAVTIPAGKWRVVADDSRVYSGKYPSVSGTSVTVAPISALILAEW